MRKIFLIFSILLLTGCNAKIDAETKSMLKSKTERIIQQLNDKDYASIIEEASFMFQSAVDTQTLQQSWESIPDVYGEFKTIDKLVFLAINDVYQVKLILNYEHYKAQYTIAFDDHLDLIGIFYK